MTIEVWTPRGLELIDAEDFRLNWVLVRSGLLADTYDRKPSR